MQQQQNDIHLQQLPVNSLLPATQPAITTNPFLAMHNDSNAPKAGASAATIRQTKVLTYYIHFELLFILSVYIINIRICVCVCVCVCVIKCIYYTFYLIDFEDRLKLCLFYSETGGEGCVCDRTGEDLM